MSKNKILPIFLPFVACGNICTYCNQNAITKLESPIDVMTSARQQLEKWEKMADDWQTVAFYGGNFGAISKKLRKELYDLAGDKKIRFSTRPDTITDEIINEISEYKIDSVELGVQSLDNEVLKANGRCYNADEALVAVQNLCKVTDCGVQLMNGLYKQSYFSSINDAEILSKLAIKTARIYPTLVLKDTELLKLAEEGKYQPTKFSDILLTSAGSYIHFKANGIDVIRVGLPDDVSENVILGAKHAAFGDIVKTLIILLYLESSGKVHYQMAGYKGICKALYPDRYCNIAVPFQEICKVVRGEYCASSEWFIKGKAADFASQLESSAYNR